MKPSASEWVEDTKIEALKTPNAREAELRERALMEKEKEMAELQQEMVRFLLWTKL